MAPWIRVAIAHQIYAWVVVFSGLVVSLGYGFQDKADWPILVQMIASSFKTLWFTATFPFWTFLESLTDLPGAFMILAFAANSVFWGLTYQAISQRRRAG